MLARVVIMLALSAGLVACEAETLRLTATPIDADAGVAIDADAWTPDPAPSPDANVIVFADAAVQDAAAPDAAVEPLDPETIVEVSSGGHHSCVRRASGRVTCWGSMTSGELNGGEAMEGSVQLAMGGYPSIGWPGGHTCSVREDGQAWCWGDNYNGQLGRGNDAGTNLEAGPMLATDVVAIGAGPFNTCVIDRSRALFCAGLNNASQLALPPDEVDYGEPVRIAAVEDVVKIAIAGWHMCAMLADGSARCWGATLRGKLGSGGSAGIDYESDPQRVLDLEDAIDISAQQEHTCAARRSGQVVCWGENLAGQLGYGRRDEWGDGVPKTVDHIDDAIGVAVGQRHSCALRASGEVWCWGSNEDGQLGSDSSEIWALSPVRVVGIERAIALSSGQKHACAVIAGEPRTVMCWGHGRNNELGNGTHVNSAIPVRAAAADL